MDSSTYGKVYTLGYSGFPEVSCFVAALKKHGISLLVDVRSSPYSSFYTQYDRENLERSLKLEGILYRNYAKEFGARQEDRSFYKDGILNFESFTDSVQFSEGVKKIDAALGAGYQPALMCAEKNPTECHRSIMVGKRLSDIGYEVIHLLPENIIKTQNDVTEELLDMYFPRRNNVSLFDEDNLDEETMIREAYIRQNQKIGFKLEDMRK